MMMYGLVFNKKIDCREIKNLTYFVKAYALQILDLDAKRQNGLKT